MTATRVGSSRRVCGRVGKVTKHFFSKKKQMRVRSRGKPSAASTDLRVPQTSGSHPCLVFTASSSPFEDAAARKTAAPRAPPRREQERAERQRAAGFIDGVDRTRVNAMSQLSLSIYTLPFFFTYRRSCVCAGAFVLRPDGGALSRFATKRRDAVGRTARAAASAPEESRAERKDWKPACLVHFFFF